MRKICLLLIVIAVHAQLVTFSQSCLPDGITFTSQQEIDDFQINYPGCQEIDGDVLIKGIEITSLNGLSSITSFGGDLTIDTTFLINLNGLGNVTSIEGGLTIKSHQHLEELTGINNLEYIGGSLLIHNNHALSSLNGLQGLINVGGYIWFYWNDVLPGFNGLNGLTTVGGDFYFNCYDNDILNDLTGLGSLTHIGGDFGLSGDFLSFSGAEALTTIGGIFGFSSDKLINLNGLGNLTSTGGLNILDCGLIENLNGLQNLTEVNGPVKIKNNVNLNDISGLENIDCSLITELKIIWNPNLTQCNIQSFCEFMGIAPELAEISGNATGCESEKALLNSCGITVDCAEGGLRFSTQEEVDDFNINYPYCNIIKGDLIISGYDITNLDALSELTVVEGDLKIFGNSLNNLAGLSNITQVGGDVWIMASWNLFHPTLTSLTTIGGGLLIIGNDKLNSIHDLSNLDAASIDHIQISHNPKLSYCDISSVCDYLASPTAEVVIYNNTGLCNSVEQVESECGITGTSCLPQGVIFENQLQINNFQNDYPGCQIIEGDVVINGNEISSLSQLEVLSQIIGDLRIYGNNNLVDLSGLQNIFSIGGNLIIGETNKGNNPSLQNLNGLQSLLSVGGDLQINSNPQLLDISQLTSLGTIQGDLVVYDNPVLISLEGLQNIEPDGIESLYIHKNISLATCTAESICEVIAEPAGIILIEDNAEGCNNEVNISEACTFGITDVSGQKAYSIHPQPASGKIIISVSGNMSLEKVEIYNLTGQKVTSSKQKLNILDVSMLKPGVYLMELQLSGELFKEKIIVE